MNQSKSPSAISPFLGLSVSLLFTAFGSYLYFIKAAQVSTANADAIRLTGASCITFFGILMLMSLIRLFSKGLH